MAETVILLTKFVGKFSHDYEAIDKFDKFLKLLLDDNIDAFTNSINGGETIKKVYNELFNPLQQQQHLASKKKRPPLVTRKNKSKYITLSSREKYVGDVIGDDFRYRNEGKLFWDGANAIPLSTEFDETGHVPPILCVGKDVQDALYWQDTIKYNHLVYVLFDTIDNLVCVESGCGIYTFTYKGVPWLAIGDNVTLETLTTPMYWDNVNVNTDYLDVCSKYKVDPIHVIIQK